jgi:hypothetical protein
VHSKDEGCPDAILEEFPSFVSFPNLPNVTNIRINGFTLKTLSHFSLEGIGQFRALKSLSLNLVDRIDGAASLTELAELETLRLCGDSFKNLQGIGTHPKLKILTMDCRLENLEGLENFPSLDYLEVGPVGDISLLLRYADEKKCHLSYGCKPCDQYAGYHPHRFYFHKPS